MGLLDNQSIRQKENRRRGDTSRASSSTTGENRRLRSPDPSSPAREPRDLRSPHPSAPSHPEEKKSGPGFWEKVSGWRPSLGDSSGSEPEVGPPQGAPGLPSPEGSGKVLRIPRFRGVEEEGGGPSPSPQRWASREASPDPSIDPQVEPEEFSSPRERPHGSWRSVARDPRRRLDPELNRWSDNALRQSQELSVTARRAMRKAVPVVGAAGKVAGAAAGHAATAFSGAVVSGATVAARGSGDLAFVLAETLATLGMVLQAFLAALLLGVEATGRFLGWALSFLGRLLAALPVLLTQGGAAARMVMKPVASRMEEAAGMGKDLLLTELEDMRDGTPDLRGVSVAVSSQWARLQGAVARRRWLPRVQVPTPRRAWMAAAAGVVISMAASLVVLGGNALWEWSRHSPSLVVKIIEVAGGSRLSDQEVLRAAQITPGSPILDVDIDQVGQRLSGHPWIRTAHVTRRLPDRVYIAIEERVPRLLLASSSLWLVDEDGLPFVTTAEAGEFASLPVVTGVTVEKGGTVGEVEKEKLRGAIAVAAAFEGRKHLNPKDIGEIRIDEAGRYHVYTAREGTLLSLGREDLSQRIGRLDLLLDRGKVSLTEVESVDLDLRSRAVVRPRKGLKG